MRRHCVANADTVTTIPKQFLVEYAGSLDGGKVEQLDAALRFALDLD
ncbi:MAG: type II toxin-antitoxin system PemK/MazF family toxin [Acidobacteria bacterium]|nr:type II toxin-antitoxin system PemK/MazF family toxin [Acidobacteriota bacterium]